MKILSYLIAIILGFLGLMFVAGSQGQVIRIVVGIILLGAAAVFIYLTRMRPQVTQTETTLVQKIDLSGDVSLEKMTCDNCGAPLTKNSIEVKAGAIFVNCEHCGATYQIEEEAKW
jgi:RNase P subunit RPR2